MLPTDFSAFLSVCGGNPSSCCKSFHDASFDRQSNRHCLESGYAANLTAVDVEDLIGIWMDVQGRVSRNEPCPSTVDALYVQGKNWFLVEFKRNEKKTLNAMKAKLMYKAYDSVLQLVEHGLRTVTQFRENDYYICSNVFKVLGREISKGIKNGSRVERADYIAGLIVAGVSLVSIIGSLCSNIKGLNVGIIMIGCIVALIFVLLASVWFVLMEEERMKIIDNITHINCGARYVRGEFES